MYGLDSAGGWNRVLGVIPNEYRAQIDNAKANTDFWVNLWFLSFAVLVEYVSFTIFALFRPGTSFNFLFGDLISAGTIWIPAIALLTIILANVRARSAAMEWGDLVKSAFDIFLPDLRKQLGLRTPSTMGEDRDLWATFSRALIYGDPRDVDDLANFRAEGSNQAQERAHQLEQELHRLRQERQEQEVRLREEARRLREELEAERAKGFWVRLFGG
jgi:hypothetical protein